MSKLGNILMIGPMPPPAGGISIHLQRLMALLGDQWTFDVVDESTNRKSTYFHFRSLQLITYWKKVRQADLLFVHSGNKLFKIFHILAGKLAARKVVITLHGYGKRRNFLLRHIDQFFYRLADWIILVNEGIYQKLDLPARKTRVKHAFLPPVMRQEPALPNELQDAIHKARAAGQAILCGNASRLDTFLGQDLYGLDMLLRLSVDLKHAGHTSFFIVFTVSALDAGKDRFDEAQAFIQQQGLSAHFMLYHGGVSFARLIESSDIMVRPTATDGDSLSIREALYLGKPVVCSDVVSRPDGCHLFATRNQDALLRTVTSLLVSDRAASAKQPTAVVSEESYATFYNELFTALLSSAS